jgi:large subunit ribosomal protein L6
VSRIGRKPITLPDGVDVACTDSVVTVKGPKGELTVGVVGGLDVVVNDGTVRVQRLDEARQTRAFHGLVRALVANAVMGVTQGFEKRLEIVGVGYRADMEGEGLRLLVGYSHPVVIEPPEGVEIGLDSPTRILVRGIDRQLVGQVAADIRAVRPPEVYKGKGIRYEGERVRRKQGKTAR